MKKLINHPHWEAVASVVRLLNKNKFKAYLAGGCVRDGLMGRVPNDFDVATNATPDEVERIFPKSLGVGKEFGVMILPFEGFRIDVATFRSDGQYVDGRHPESVHFSTAKEDALRRDFTINGMFYDIQSDQLIDYVGGQKDIINQLIRTVGEPERRFSEDYLRMMRAIRFASQLQFQIESETFGSISKLSHQIENVSGERIYAELKKTFISPEPLEGFNRFAETGVLKSLFPKMKLFQAIWSEGEYDFWTQFKSVIHGLGRDSREEIFWSMMIYFECLMPSDSTNKAPSEKLMERMGESFEFLHFSNELRRRIFFIVRALLRLMQEKPLPPMAQRLRWFGDPAGLSLMDMWHILLVQGNEPTGVFFETLDRYISIAQKNGELPLSHLKGKDLIEMGIKKGPLIGSLLKEVYDMQLEGKINSRQMALNWVESHIN